MMRDDVTYVPGQLEFIKKNLLLPIFFMRCKIIFRFVLGEIDAVSLIRAMNLWTIHQ